MDCFDNRLTSLNVSANMDLTRLQCGQNQLTSLNVSANTALEELYCNDNQLTSLNVKNGNNRDFTFINFKGFKATGNPDLICIQVDNVEWSTSNWPKKDATAGYSQDCSTLSMATNPVSSITPTSATLSGSVILDSESVVTEKGFVYSLSTTAVLTIGGTNVLQEIVSGTRAGVFSKTITGLTESTRYHYKSYAIKNNITVYGDVQNFRTEAPATAPTVSTTSASAVTRISATLNGNITSDGRSLIIERGFVYSLSSTDLIIGGTNVSRKIISGIETGIFTKDIAGLTANTMYYYKAYATNGVDTGYGNSQSFRTSRTDATHIPDDTFRRVLQNTYNITADANGYILNSDAATITSLSLTYGSQMDLTGIEAFTALTSLICNNSSFLTGLDISKNTALEILNISSCRLISLDVTKNTALTSLKCGGNRFAELDVSKNTALIYLNCRNNELTSLNVANGNNRNFSPPPSSSPGNYPIRSGFSATSNYNLRCIQVDDVSYSTTNWDNIGTAIYSTNCEMLTTATTAILARIIHQG